MALNPPQLADGTPTRLEGQYFVLSRQGIEFQVNIPNAGKKSGKGWLVISTARIVLINQKKSDLQAFDIPMAYMYNQKFNQPIFGANYYSGATKPLFDLITGDVSFKIWFMRGGCGKFLRAVRSVVQQIRSNKNRGPSSDFLHSCNSGAFMQEMSYFDPNDPSTIYFTQPPAQKFPGGGASAVPPSTYSASSVPQFVQRAPAPAPAPVPVPAPPASSSIYRGPPPSVIAAPSVASVHPSGAFIPKPVKGVQRSEQGFYPAPPPSGIIIGGSGAGYGRGAFYQDSKQQNFIPPPMGSSSIHQQQQLYPQVPQSQPQYYPGQQNDIIPPAHHLQHHREGGGAKYYGIWGPSIN